MNVTLRPDRSLLDPNFESYKLSLTKIPIYSAEIPNKITQHKLPIATFSKLPIKAHFDFNCLISDPFKSGFVYYINSEGSVILVLIPERPQSFNAGRIIFNIPTNNELRRKFDDTYVTIQFPSIDLYVIYDGSGSLRICHPNLDVNEWQLLSSVNPPLDNKNSRLVDCLLVSSVEGKSTELNCLFVSVEESQRSTKTNITKTEHVTHIHWISYEQIDNSTWQLSKHNQFISKSYPDFVAFEKDALAIHICSDKPFTPISDSEMSEGEVIDDEPSQTNLGPKQMSGFSVADSNSQSSIISSIRWCQTQPDSDLDCGSITISFPLNPDMLASKFNPDSVQIKLQMIEPIDEAETSSQILNVQLISSPVGAQNDPTKPLVLIDQALFGIVKDGETTWTVDRDNHCLDIHLTKQHLLDWPRLLKDPLVDRNLCINQIGTIGITNAESDANLEELTAPRQTFNIAQLEDVDFPMDEEDGDLILQRFSAESLECTHKANLSGHQWLLKLQCLRHSSNFWKSTQAFCIRFDVDGIVWLPYSSLDKEITTTSNQNHNVTPIWKHVSTLQAFGYVLASKRDHRFVVCPPLDDEKPIPFVAVADTSKRIYIYRQPIANMDSIFPGGDTELRRRNTNISNPNSEEKQQGVVHVAWQYVVSLPTDDPVVGFLALDKPYPACIVCTCSTLYLLSLAG